MSSTRTIKVGKLTIVLDNVPDDVPDEELKRLMLIRLYEQNTVKTTKQKMYEGMAS